MEGDEVEWAESSRLKKRWGGVGWSLFVLSAIWSHSSQSTYSRVLREPNQCQHLLNMPAITKAVQLSDHTQPNVRRHLFVC